LIAALVAVALVAAAVIGWLRLGRHGHAEVPAAHWRRTDEVFRDPSSGRPPRVWIDPTDQSRHYVPETDPPHR
jgi:hypothetical protein